MEPRPRGSKQQPGEPFSGQNPMPDGTGAVTEYEPLWRIQVEPDRAGNPIERVKGRDRGERNPGPRQAAGRGRGGPLAGGSRFPREAPSPVPANPTRAAPAAGATPGGVQLRQAPRVPG